MLNLNLIEKWKNRETKKKIKEENILLKAQLAAEYRKPSLVSTIERNVQKVCVSWNSMQIGNNIPADIIKSELLYKLKDGLSDFVEYDFLDDELTGDRVYRATLYIATGDKRENVRNS